MSWGPRARGLQEDDNKCVAAGELRVTVAHDRALEMCTRHAGEGLALKYLNESVSSQSLLLCGVFFSHPLPSFQFHPLSLEGREGGREGERDPRI